jgi:serine phosphatase RsbU (regulator of sigma subunit)
VSALHTFPVTHSSGRHAELGKHLSCGGYPSAFGIVWRWDLTQADTHTIFGLVAPRPLAMLTSPINCPVRSLFNREKSFQAPAEPVQASVPELRQAELAAAYYGERQGGDHYDFVRVGPNRVLFGLLDIAGRVEENGPVVSAAQQTFRTRSPELFTGDDINEPDAMAELCLELNRAIMAAEGGIRSCPAFAGCYNEDLGTICYFNAGHTPGLLRDPSGIIELKATGLPMGLFSHATCDASLVALPPGAALLLVSRGVLEGKRKREEFGLDRVKSELQQAVGETAKELCAAMIDGVQQFMQKPPIHNDVTALALVRATDSKA